MKNIFQECIHTKSIFKQNSDILRPSYVPEILIHRDTQIKRIANILSMALKGNRPSNILLFGRTGTGKTVTVKYIGKEITKAASSNDNKYDIRYIYVNCETVNTNYGVFHFIGNSFIDNFYDRIPSFGWSNERVYNRMKERLDSSPKIVVVVLDGIDSFINKNGDTVLYRLAKINEDLINSKLSIIGVSNDIRYIELLDPRILSHLNDEKIAFSSYDSVQLNDILRNRTDIVFENGVIDENVISLCAAIGGNEHGDARRTLDLLRTSAEIVESESKSIITEQHVIKARDKLNFDWMIESVNLLSDQSKLVLYSIIYGFENCSHRQTTGEIYGIYKDLTKKAGIKTLTQRRIADLITELDMIGFIEANIKSYGRGGRTRLIMLMVSNEIIELKRILKADLMFDSGELHG